MFFPHVRIRRVPPHITHQQQLRCLLNKEQHEFEVGFRGPTRVVHRCPAVVVSHKQRAPGLQYHETDDVQIPTPARHVCEALPEPVAALQTPPGLEPFAERPDVLGPDLSDNVVIVRGDFFVGRGVELVGLGRKTDCGVATIVLERLNDVIDGVCLSLLLLLLDGKV